MAGLPASKLKLQVTLTLPKDTSADNSNDQGQTRKLLVIIDPDTSIRQLRPRIEQLFARQYPQDKGDLTVRALTDKAGFALDDDYLLGEVFEHADQLTAICSAGTTQHQQHSPPKQKGHRDDKEDQHSTKNPRSIATEVVIPQKTPPSTSASAVAAPSAPATASTASTAAPAAETKPATDASVSTNWSQSATQKRADASDLISKTLDHRSAKKIGSAENAVAAARAALAAAAQSGLVPQENGDDRRVINDTHGISEDVTMKASPPIPATAANTISSMDSTYQEQDLELLDEQGAKKQQNLLRAQKRKATIARKKAEAEEKRRQEADEPTVAASVAAAADSDEAKHIGSQSAAVDKTTNQATDDIKSPKRQAVVRAPRAAATKASESVSKITADTKRFFEQADTFSGEDEKGENNNGTPEPTTARISIRSEANKDQNKVVMDPPASPPTPKKRGRTPAKKEEDSPLKRRPGRPPKVKPAPETVAPTVLVSTDKNESLTESPVIASANQAPSVPETAAAAVIKDDNKKSATDDRKDTEKEEQAKDTDKQQEEEEKEEAYSQQIEEVFAFLAQQRKKSLAQAVSARTATLKANHSNTTSAATTVLASRGTPPHPFMANTPPLQRFADRPSIQDSSSEEEEEDEDANEDDEDDASHGIRSMPPVIKASRPPIVSPRRGSSIPKTSPIGGVKVATASRPGSSVNELGISSLSSPVKSAVKSPASSPMKKPSVSAATATSPVDLKLPAAATAGTTPGKAAKSSTPTHEFDFEFPDSGQLTEEDESKHGGGSGHQESEDDDDGNHDEEEEPLVLHRKNLAALVPVKQELESQAKAKAVSMTVKQEKTVDHDSESSDSDSSGDDDENDQAKGEDVESDDDSTSSDSEDDSDDSDDDDDDDDGDKDDEMDSKKAQVAARPSSILSGVMSLKGATTGTKVNGTKSNHSINHSNHPSTLPSLSRTTSSGTSSLFGNGGFASLSDISSMNGLNKITSLSALAAQSRANKMIGSIGSALTSPVSSSSSSTMHLHRKGVSGATIGKGGHHHYTDEDDDDDTDSDSDSDSDNDSSDDDDVDKKKAAAPKGPQVKIAGKKRKASYTSSQKAGAGVKGAPAKRKKGALNAMFD
ncbi:hypothetical protein EDD11_002092 [Mortierella claussenii]|nr:hypothetical protein EDD11_002092 [Mortierella claussenii]